MIQEMLCTMWKVNSERRCDTRSNVYAIEVRGKGEDEVK